MQRKITFTLLGACLLASCMSPPDPLPTHTPVAMTVVPAHAPEIRFALIAEPRELNVWELFDETGAGYADYALRAEYWPRLYHLPPPEFGFQPLAAQGMPTPVKQEAEFLSATVNLRSDLKWTDGSSFTAEDVAFTVNTALDFELGFDWEAYFSRDHLSRAEFVSPNAVKFVFRQPPDVKVWQYGALQGPVVQKEFWEPIIQDAAALLPDDSLRSEVEAAREYVLKVQASVDSLTLQVNALRLSGGTNRKLEASLTAGQNELIYAQNSLNKLLAQYEAQTEAARQVLYAVEDRDEPTLGTWMPAVKQDDAWVNQANPDFPFVQPNFDRAVYVVYGDLDAALSAFENDEVDVILSPHGVPVQSWAWPNPTPSGRFLVFNPGRAVLADPAIRRAMSCMIRRSAMTTGQEEPYDGFILGRPWRNEQLSFACSELSDGPAIENSVRILKEAGYTWAQEPASDRPGAGLTLPDGTPFPPLVLTTTLPEYEFWRVHAAEYIQLQFRQLGIPMTLELTDPESLRYAVYSSGEYDLAIFGWGLSLYPDYLCEWFEAGGRFDYGSERLNSECQALAVDSDLESARQHLMTIQSILMDDLPFLPLYARFTYDAVQNVRYPFENILGGLGGLYGAPSLAFPAR